MEAYSSSPSSPSSRCATGIPTCVSPAGRRKADELAFLTAVTRSTEMPPYDPWFAGGTMNYYYMGWFFLAVPIRALRLVPEIAFTWASRHSQRWQPRLLPPPAQPRRLSASTRVTAGNLLRHRRPAIVAGLFGAALFMGIGTSMGRTSSLSGSRPSTPGGRSRACPSSVVQPGLWAGSPNGCSTVSRSPLRLVAKFTRSHRLPRHHRVPYWTFLFADLHPHLMGLPFFGLVVALAMAYVVSAGSGAQRHSWALAAVLGLALGLVRTVHTWTSRLQR